MKSIRVATPYTSVDDLVAVYAQYCDADGCFVPTPQSRPVGLEAAFALQLADGTVVLRGNVIVRAAYTREASPYGRAGVRLGFKSLSEDTAALFARLLEPTASERSQSAPPDGGADGSNTPTTAMPAVVPPRESSSLGVPLAIHDDATVRGTSTILGFAPLCAARTAIPAPTPTPTPRPRAMRAARVIDPPSDDDAFATGSQPRMTTLAIARPPYRGALALVLGRLVGALVSLWRRAVPSRLRPVARDRARRVALPRLTRP